MKWIAMLAVTILCSAGAAAAAPAEWTVMVFMNAADDLEEDAVIDLVEMRRAMPAKGINVVVQCKRAGKVFASTGMKTWTGALRFRVGDKQPDPKKHAFAANMADKATLRDFIVWAKKTWPAKRYALVIWCHGSGWRRYQLAAGPGLFPSAMTSTSAGDAPSVSTPREVYAPAGMRDTSYKACSADGTDVLMNAEAAEAIAEAMAGTKLDLLAFDSCLMQMMETVYAFRNVASVLVASEDLVPGSGFQYEKWLKRLAAAPSSSGAVVADMLVQEFAGYYALNGETTLSAVDLTQTASLAKSVSAFADAARAALAGEAALIAEARKECAVFAPAECMASLCIGGGFNHVDLRRFADRVAARTATAALRAAAAALSAAIDAAVRDHPWAGAERDASTDHGSYGIAIYFPLDGKTFREDEWNDGSYDKPATNRFAEYPVMFVADQTWADFLHAYFAAVPKVQ